MSNENTFKASNGWTVEEGEGFYEVRDEDSSLMQCIYLDTFGTLREYFRHERDEELGRTRWPVDTDYVIYRVPGNDVEDGLCVRVLNEADGATQLFWEIDKHLGKGHPFSKAADWWFETNHEPEPRPWEYAQEGEVWRITCNGTEQNALARKPDDIGVWFSADDFYVNVKYTGVTAGRKLVNADGSVADG